MTSCYKNSTVLFDGINDTKYSLTVDYLNSDREIRMFEMQFRFSLIWLVLG